mmetsp:Transcript_76/g.259  ORF Transcript_76/g.259 Transcript_76/m.259 type:complete len:252 (-) Transcript_76:7-762(-)
MVNHGTRLIVRSAHSLLLGECGKNVRRPSCRRSNPTNSAVVSHLALQQVQRQRDVERARRVSSCQPVSHGVFSRENGDVRVERNEVHGKGHNAHRRGGTSLFHVSHERLGNAWDDGDDDVDDVSGFPGECVNVARYQAGVRARWPDNVDDTFPLRGPSRRVLVKVKQPRNAARLERSDVRHRAERSAERLVEDERLVSRHAVKSVREQSPRVLSEVRHAVRLRCVVERGQHRGQRVLLALRRRRRGHDWKR